MVKRFVRVRYSMVLELMGQVVHGLRGSGQLVHGLRERGSTGPRSTDLVQGKQSLPIEQRWEAAAGITLYVRSTVFLTCQVSFHPHKNWGFL